LRAKINRHIEDNHDRGEVDFNVGPGGRAWAVSERSIQLGTAMIGRSGR
jgi:hypothetical protein